MNDFFKDFTKAMETPTAQNIINRYNKGLYTLSDAISALLDEYNNSDFVYVIQYKRSGTKDRYKNLSDTEYTQKEITLELRRLKEATSDYTFRQFPVTKEVIASTTHDLKVMGL